MADAKIEAMERTIGNVGQAAPPANGADSPQPGPPQPPGKPEILGVNVREKVLVTTIGTIALNSSEVSAISKIAAKAFKRAMNDLVSQISKGVSGVKRGRPPKDAAPPSPTGKRRGRPPKVQPAVPAGV